MIQIGDTYNCSTFVNEKNTAAAMFSGDLAVFSTPSMAALMEQAALTLLSKHLSAEDTSVGIALNITHSKASKLGAEITATATVTAIDGRKISFDVEAWDPDGLIGKGTHERFVVNRERFLSKL
ncbi:dihydrolipoamide acyltransferase [Porphyromonas crevioricanis]|uniref:Dihydrolipoamide acyltransferase n=1 Tax=Porphyromonas crevioricanis TaxID=393921 RepID=A0A0A2FCS0_9PORP|nr:thioesterase family protein [Porphyromonas crevioricanis]KGN88831.1 dihydrolipoamide acyltransferase [Porphyromonas crevioricanis]KGN95925.1 dihydrolipoamide acyltransferase [Porphyromonas crevioricanis]GAD07844.1 conserved hypothetical protein [Porphyromonas crevioricanis JCM 13913]SQH73542.1 Thioesterase superfamily [Porphyromonas crevioricanis]